MGIMGAAVASGLGQLLSFMILISHFIRKRGDLRICRYKCSFTLAKKICNRGVPECFTQLNTPVTAFCYNWVLAGTLGDMGVATFSVLSFIYSLANAILSGVAQGLQPLWGQAFGKNDKGELKSDFLAGMKIILLVSVIIYVILVVFRIPVVIEFIKYVLYKRWLGQEYQSDTKRTRGAIRRDCNSYFESCYKNLDKRSKAKLDYFKPYVAGRICIEAVTDITRHDNDKEFYRNVLLSFPEKNSQQ